MQKNFIPTVLLRSIALLAVVSVLAFILFLVKKPEKPFELSKFISVYWGAFVLALIVIEHVVIKFDLSYKQAIIMADVLSGSFIAGYVYSLIPRKIEEKADE